MLPPGKINRTSPVRIASIIVACLCLFSCTKPPVQEPGGIADLERYTQKTSYYLPVDNADTLLIDTKAQQEADADWNRHFFAPWRLRKASIPKDAAFWGAKSYGEKQGYAENLQPYSREEWEALVVSQQIDSYPSLARPAIAVRNTSFRVLPTIRPFFLDSQLPGEGFPFDYFQASAIWVGTPLLVTHVSADQAWFFAEAGHVFGWLPAGDVAWVNKNFQRRYENSHYAALIKDNVSLFDTRGTFLTQTHLGAVFPIDAAAGDVMRVLIPVRDSDGNGVIKVTELSTALAISKPLPLTAQRIADIADAIIGQHYGWGGLYENRDCSATMRDLFTPFGIWLGRNSRHQGSKGGEFHNLDGLKAEEKRDAIVAAAVPFYTLIWLKGHIGLYLGIEPSSGEPLLLHNVWGVHTRDKKGREGRALIGKLAVTSLRLGEEHSNVPKDAFYDRILGFTILPGRGNDAP